MAETSTILAIESAIRGGSIALAVGGEIIDTWLGEGGHESPVELVVPFPVAAMTAWRVSTLVNAPTRDDAACARPLAG